MAPTPPCPDRRFGAGTSAATPASGASAARDDAAAAEWLQRCCGEFPEAFGPLALLLAVSVLVRLPATSPLRARLAVWLECVLLHAYARRSGDVAALRRRLEAHRRAAFGRDRTAPPRSRRAAPSTAHAHCWPMALSLPGRAPSTSWRRGSGDASWRACRTAG